MALRQRDGEEVLQQLRKHWLSYLPAHLWWFVLIIVALAFLELGWIRLGLGCFFISFSPVFYRYLRNRASSFILTSQRLYLEEGLLSKTKLDIPLSKINDVLLRQNFLQRLFKAGDLEIMTGNDQVRTLSHIAEPEQVKDALSRYL